MTTPYRIETERLVLRCHDPSKAEIAKRAEDESREHLASYLPWAARGPETLDQVVAKLRKFRAQFDDDTLFAYVGWDRVTGAYVGSVSFGGGKDNGWNIGYWMHPAWIKKGLASEMAAAIIRVGFELKNARYMEVRCVSDNVASAGVPRKLGFPHCATLPELIERGDGTFAETLVFTMLARDYQTSRIRSMAIEAYDILDRRCL